MFCDTTVSFFANSGFHSHRYHTVLNKSLTPATPRSAIAAHTIHHEFIQLFIMQNRIRRNRQIARGRQCHLGNKLRLASDTAWQAGPGCQRRQGNVKIPVWLFSSPGQRGQDHLFFWSPLPFDLGLELNGFHWPCHFLEWPCLLVYSCLDFHM